jgi:hypothetical protein
LFDAGIDRSKDYLIRKMQSGKSQNEFKEYWRIGGNERYDFLIVLPGGRRHHFISQERSIKPVES